MKSIAEFYAKEMRKKYGQFYVAWPIGSPFQLGDYGLLKDGVFSHLGNVKQLGFDFQVREDGSSNPESFSSNGVSSTQITADGKIVTGVADIATGFEVEFTGENQVLFETMDAKIHKIDNIAKLNAQLCRMYEQKKEGPGGERWYKKYVIITELYVSKGTTILISNTKNAKITIQASVDTSKLHLNISDPKLGLTSLNNKGVTYSVIAKESLTPLFKVAGLSSREIRMYSRSRANSITTTEMSRVPVKQKLSFVQVTTPSWSGRSTQKIIKKH